MEAEVKPIHPWKGQYSTESFLTVISQRIVWNLCVLGPCLEMAGFDLLKHLAK
ncbi:hypothetical protein OAG07_02575 [Verrucomicrobia bacterium]|nr:hypothetical protein [Verrucomicrobiota bacterium]